MRTVSDPGDLPEAFQSCKSEAEKAFGDGSLYLEKHLEGPRHVEFQILADSFGNVVHLFERECSIQRRHQKIIEETPSPALTPDLRRQMGQAAKAAARAAGYVNAGTVEFLLDREGNFYFLEVNTRLQVEHPITEVTTGLRSGPATNWKSPPGRPCLSGRRRSSPGVMPLNAGSMRRIRRPNFSLLPERSSTSGSLPDPESAWTAASGPGSRCRWNTTPF